MFEPVTLRTAFAWTCHCGHEHFAPAEVTPLDDDEREEAYRHFHDLEVWAELPPGWREFQLVRAPQRVTCRRCGKEYETREQFDV